ncbi:NusG domain II-containing protein [Geothermobacter hydrogeniphilus]|uniref:Uncharacterized protein n=1 Tax=Geothermobacter hydrogeniphilus TaxID=1969733 RepID=A0A1X0YB38_9BACT|nr:NusG domain II-containing protein [Geothermobacter hydrogeniphilus]ORJ62204.1 hypothetical protein B5V00_05515 [Geothermobacter hydrogeniphilus]
MALKALWRRMTPLDRMLLCGLLGVALLLCVLVFRLPGGSRLVVERDGRIIYRAPLDRDRRMRLAGPLGETLAVIEHGTVRVLASPCRHKVCIGMGRISRSGEWLACVPNHLLLRIEGGRSPAEDGYDLISR